MGTENAELWEFIAQRLEPNADVESIDRTIWERFGETHAIMFTDLAGFSRHAAEFGILRFLEVIHEHRRLVDPIIAAGGGELLKMEADSCLIVFREVNHAIESALRMREACAEFNKGRPLERRVLLCIGIGYGRVLKCGPHDVYGEEVNAASKLGEDIARAEEILITKAAKTRASLSAVRFEEIVEQVPGSPSNFRVLVGT